MKTLTEIFERIGNHTGVDIGCNDKNGLHTYLETYDKLFAPFQKGCSFLEIGLALGDSIDLWDEYFENSKIVGADISIVFGPKEYKNEVSIIEADATKPSFLTFVAGEKFDIIIDDSSHMEQDQIDTFNLLKFKMKPGGLYIIEDILALDYSRERLVSLHDNCEVIDMRHTGRFDNVLLVYQF
jgi:hypothetical protein